MKTQESASHFPAEIISHCVWRYFRFSLSFRNVEEIMAERGVMLTYETIRQWCFTFGQQYANEVKRSRPRTGDKWHLDEVFLTHQWENALLMASRRSVWKYSRYFGSE